MYLCVWSDRIRQNLHNGIHSLSFSNKYVILLHFFYHHYCFVQTGPDGASEEEWGVNYRALNDLFKISQSRKSNIAYEVGVQMVEIYNEQVRDLLSGDSSQKRYPFLSALTWFSTPLSNFLLQFRCPPTLCLCASLLFSLTFTL